MRNLLLAAVVLAAGSFAAACVPSASGAVASSSPSPGGPATATAPPTPTPTAASPTAPPSTASPTAAPSTATTAPSPSTSTSPASSSGFGFNLIWLWVILGAAVLVGIILLATRSPARTRSPVAGPGWRAKVVDAYAKGAALDSAVRAAERQGTFTEAGGTRWADLQRRVDDLSQTLYAMRETAPSEHRRFQVEDALAALLTVRSAMDALRAPEGPRSPQGAALNARLSALESALNALRVPDDPVA